MTDTATWNEPRWQRDSRYSDHWKRFGPKYAGKRDEDAEEFLRRVYEYSTARELSEEELLRALPEAFTGDALLWHRVECTSWTSFEGFVFYFRERFGHGDLQERLRREVELRTQGPGEPVAEFLVKIRTLFSHLYPPLSLETQLDICCANLHPDLAQFIERDEIASFVDLQRLGRRREEQGQRAKSYRPPPSKEQSALPTAAYAPPERAKVGRLAAAFTTETAPPKTSSEPPSPAATPSPSSPRQSRRSRRSPKPQDPDSTTTPVEAAKPASQSPLQTAPLARLADVAPRTRPGTQQQPSPQSMAPRRCYNCRQPGHIYRDCVHPLGYFCRICGWPGVDVNNCNNCARRRAGNAAPGGQ